jgi:hypothetical protein
MEQEGIYLQLGQSIVSPNDPLKKITPDQLHQMVSKPSPDLQSKVHQLRTVLSLDPKRYQALKRMLPYVTCGIFNPQYRRTQNFASISCFMIDIDHLSQKNIDSNELKNRLKADDRIHMIFTSPSNDGLKLLFMLTEKCFDYAKYSIFYKVFTSRFSTEHKLEQSVDKVTSDVTRACFLSVDENAWFNPFAQMIDMNAFVDFESESRMKKVFQEIKESEDTSKLVEGNTPKSESQELPSDVIQQIKEKLNPNIKLMREKQLFVPEELNDAEKTVKTRMEELGIKVKLVQPLNYGKKFVFELDHRMAQLNLHYGSKGFKIVKQPINGVNEELMEITYQILCEIFY